MFKEIDVPSIERVLPNANIPAAEPYELLAHFFVGIARPDLIARRQRTVPERQDSEVLPIRDLLQGGCQERVINDALNRILFHAEDIDPDFGMFLAGDDFLQCSKIA